MKYRITLLSVAIMFFGSIVNGQSNVGIGTNAPNNNLHVHETELFQPVNLHLTNSTSGTSSEDGLVMSANGSSGSLILKESGTLSLGTSNSTKLQISSLGNIGMNGNPLSYAGLNLLAGTNNYGAYLNQNYSGNSTKYGLYTYVNNGGSGSRYGVLATSYSPVSSANTYGVYGVSHQGNTSSKAYGVYGYVTGSGSGERWAGYFSGKAKVTSELHINDKIEFNPFGYASAGTFVLYDNDGTKTFQLRGNESVNQGSDLHLYNESGNMAVELDGDVGGNGSGSLDLYDEDGTKTIQLRGAEVSGQGAELKMYDDLGNLNIELDADYGGAGRVITDQLEIKGGSDLAEFFSSTEVIEAGSVVIIDSENPGMVKLSQVENDRKVIGVVSGANGVNPGMLMGQTESIAFGDLPIAIAGRVFVKMASDSESIEPGDFITTSSQLGKAAKVTEWTKAQGSILGKAMTSVDENGFVLILVHLQ